MSKRSLPLIVQLRRNVTKSRTGLDLGDTIFAQFHAVHVVQLDDQVAVLASPAKVGVAVAAGLGADLDAVVGGTLDRVLDVLGGGGLDNGDGEDRDAQVVRLDLRGPVGRGLGLIGDLGSLEAGRDGVALDGNVVCVGQGREEARGQKGSAALHLRIGSLRPFYGLENLRVGECVFFRR